MLVNEREFLRRLLRPYDFDLAEEELKTRIWAYVEALNHQLTPDAERQVVIALSPLLFDLTRRMPANEAEVWRPRAPLLL